jgi:hypothetical protein
VTSAAVKGGCLEFSTEELLTLLTGGLILDVPALARLHELGLGDHAGWATSSSMVAGERC